MRRYLFSIFLSLSFICTALAQSTGSPVPAQATQTAGADSNGNLLAVRVCDLRATISAASLNGSQQIVAGGASKKVYICGVHVVTSASVAIKFTEGTGSNCGTGTTDVTGAATPPISGGFSLPISSYAVPFTRAAADNLCVNTSGVATLGGWIAYTVQ